MVETLLKKKLREKRLDAKNVNWPPAAVKKTAAEKKKDWKSRTVIRPDKGAPR